MLIRDNEIDDISARRSESGVPSLGVVVVLVLRVLIGDAGEDVR